jgi:signal transduction histidine kinase
MSVLSMMTFFVLKIFPNLNPFLLHPGEKEFSSAYGLVFITNGMYYKFIRIFLDLSILHPRMNRMFLWIGKIIIIFGFLIFILGFFSLQHISINIFKVIFFSIIPLNLFFIIYLATRKEKINSILMLGTLLTMLIIRFSTVEFLMSNNDEFQPWNFQLILAAVLILLVCVNYALLYKNRIHQHETMKMEIQKQLELKLQRTSISADLHDDIGASLSSIHLNAIITQKTLLESTPQIKNSLSKIVHDLKLVMENMGDIVWAINVNGLEQKSMSSQLKDFYVDLMDGKNVDCHYHIDEDLERRITDINARKNILLIGKEAINNILKHAGSTRIDIRLTKEQDHMLFEIQDHGIGMKDVEGMKTGNGFRNMRLRAEKLKGTCSIRSTWGLGTTISCLIPLTNIRYNVPPLF